MELKRLTDEQFSALIEMWQMLFERLVGVEKAGVDWIGTALQNSELTSSQSTNEASTSTTQNSSLNQLSPSKQVRVSVPAKGSKTENQRLLWAFCLACARHHPDRILLRFLRARKWDVAQAVDMLVKSMAWRVSFGVEKIMEDGEMGLPRWLLESELVYFYGQDMDHRPIAFVSADCLDNSRVQPLELQKHLVFTIETAKNYLMTAPVDKITLVINLNGFGRANFDLVYIKFLINCLQSYFPESLGVCVIVNAPMLFSVGITPFVYFASNVIVLALISIHSYGPERIWSLIRPFLDPVVAAKIKFFSQEEMVKSFGAVLSPPMIPKLWGGSSCYEYRYLGPELDQIEPSKNETASAKLTATDQSSASGDEFTAQEDARCVLELRFEQSWRSMLHATKAWCGVQTASSMSSHSDDSVENQVRLKAHEQIKECWWALEPFRPKTTYHRSHIITPSGGVDWKSGNVAA